jgi:hypothetical protein
MKKQIGFALLLTFAFLFTVASAHAATYGFYCITNNDPDDAAIGEAQLFVEVTDINGIMNPDATQVLFTFLNIGPNASSIADVYFDDGSLIKIAYLIDADDPDVNSNLGDSGVDFTQLANPGNLPGANNADPDFETTAGFSADSDTPVQPEGVNPGESLGIVFDLQDGQTLSDVIAQLNDGTLRIGIHVQGFASEGSESFVNNPIPLPASILLFGTGLLGLVLRRRVNRRS